MPTAPITASAMTAFDWLLVGIVLVSALMAFSKGLVRVLFSLCGIIAGVTLASWNYLRLGAGLNRWIASLPVAQVAAFVLIVLATVVLFSIVAAAVRKAVRAVGLGFADRLLGAAFGAARGMLLGVALLMLLAAFDPASSWAADSLLSPYFLAAAHAVSFIVPQEFQARVAGGARHLMKKDAKILKENPPSQ